MRQAAEFVIGNLDEDGYLAASEEELAAALSQFSEIAIDGNGSPGASGEQQQTAALELVRRGIDLVQHLDPAGVGGQRFARVPATSDRGTAAGVRPFVCTSGRRMRKRIRMAALKAEAEAQLDERRRSMEVAALIVDRHLHLLQKRDLKDLARAATITPDEAHAGMEFIRTLDPRPGRLYNREQTRLIEPDVVFLKRGGEWVVSMNEEDMPSLRLSQRYRRMLVARKHRQRSEGLREGALPLRDATDAQHRAEEEHDPAHV